jgi:hypothetical protein
VIIETHDSDESQSNRDGDRIEQGIAEGWMRPSSGEPQLPPRRFRATRRIEDAIAEEREDRPVT